MYKCLTIVTKCEPETLVKGGAILLSQSWRLGEELSILCYDHSASHLNTVFILLSYITHASWTTLLRTGRRTEWLICYHLENQDYYKQLISEKNQHSKEVSWCFGPFFVGWFFSNCRNKISEKTALRRRLSCAHSLTVWFILRTESWWEVAGQWAEREG